MKDEDVKVQLTKKQSRVQLRQLQTELEQAHNKHSVAQYTNAQHDTRLQMALGLESEMAKDQPQTPPARRDRQRAGQDGKGYYRLRNRPRYICIFTGGAILLNAQEDAAAIVKKLEKRKKTISDEISKVQDAISDLGQIKEAREEVARFFATNNASFF